MNTLNEFKARLKLLSFCDRRRPTSLAGSDLTHETAVFVSGVLYLHT